MQAFILLRFSLTSPQKNMPPGSIFDQNFAGQSWLNKLFSIGQKFGASNDCPSDYSKHQKWIISVRSWYDIVEENLGYL